MRPIRALTMSITFAAACLIATSAWAGPEAEEIWFGTGADSLEVNENGVVTSEGAKTKTTEVDRIPGEEDWEIRVAAKLNGYAGAGPIYTEYYQTVSGQEYIVYRHEDQHDGNRNFSSTQVLSGDVGFNKNREYRVQIVQNNGKKDIVLAQGKVKLIDTGRQPEPVEGESEGEDKPSEQDEIDSLAGGDEEDEGEGEDEGKGDGEAPPPIDDTPTKKKGCSVGEDTDIGFSGVLILLALGWATRRREH
jgi:hypothetical protein